MDRSTALDIMVEESSQLGLYEGDLELVRQWFTREKIYRCYLRSLSESNE